MDKGATIFVAGHRGLLGSAVVRRLEKESYRNLILVTREQLDLRSQGPTFEFFQKHRPQYVFVCAAKVGGIVANIKAPGEFLYENLAIQTNVIEGARRAGAKKLLFVGSSCIYPAKSDRPIPETALLSGPLEPTNEGYAIAKIAGIRMCEFYRRQYGCNFISAIPTNLFGANDNYDAEGSHLLPALIAKVHRAKRENQREIEIWGSGRPRREFMLSDDCADALLFLMQHYSEADPVNVGTGIDHTVLELAETVCRVLGVQLEVKLDPSKPDGMMRKLLDVSRMTAMGWSSKTSLEQGIAMAYKDFQSRQG